jgi:hypothetical protein
MFELYAENTARASLEQAIRFDSYDRSWAFPQIIICLEVLTQQHLEIIHNFLEQRCCKIDDFHLLLIGHAGAAEFWIKYNQLLGRNSFQIIEVIDLPFGADIMLDCANPDAKTNCDNVQQHWRRNQWYDDYKKFQPDFDRVPTHHVMYLPGRNNHSIEQGYAKQYLALEISALNNSYVDQCYELPDQEQLLYWIERSNNWYTPGNVAELQKQYKILNKKSRRYIPDDATIFDTSREMYSDSFFTVVRETVMQQPYGCIGEKTMRAFYYGRAVVPTTYQGVKSLKSLGFEFIPEFDIEHDQQINFFQRSRSMIQSLQTFINDHSSRDLELLVKKHRDLWRHNSNLAFQIAYLRS